MVWNMQLPNGTKSGFKLHDTKSLGRKLYERTIEISIHLIKWSFDTSWWIPRFIMNNCDNFIQWPNWVSAHILIDSSCKMTTTSVRAEPPNASQVWEINVSMMIFLCNSLFNSKYDVTNYLKCEPFAFRYGHLLLAEWLPIVDWVREVPGSKPILHK